ncbi:MAG: hypothetical protein E6G00_12480 [Actinobacteria bacterium]|nr:MAG: hypothetical protein E6G00_12480 [Actinomycetota bacterium]
MSTARWAARPLPRRRSYRRSGPGAGAVVAGAATGTINLVARLLWLAAALVALVIVAGIALVALKANMGNSIVSSIHDAARSLASPFGQIFHPKGHTLAIAINWGIAAIVYLFVARLIVRLLGRW